MITRALCAALLFVLVEAPASAQISFKLNTSREEALKLASKLPHVDTANVNCPPFDAELRMNLDEGAYVTHIQFRRPDRITAIMRDASDGSPVVLYRDTTAGVFEAATPQFILFSDYKLQFELVPSREGKTDCRAQLGFGDDNQRRLCIDLAGIMQLPDGELRDLGSTDQVIRLERRRNDGKRDLVELHLDREPPVCVFQSWASDHPQPGKVLTLTLHTSEGRPLFELPDPARVREVMAVRDTSQEASPLSGILEFGARMKLMAEVLQAVYWHLALRHPVARDEFRIPGVSQPDWSLLEKHKTKFGPKLRDALGLEPYVDPELQPLSPTLAAEDASSVTK